MVIFHGYVSLPEGTIPLLYEYTEHLTPGLVDGHAWHRGWHGRRIDADHATARHWG